MDFKKRMIVEYSSKLNEILGNYRTEYNEIMRKTIQTTEENDSIHIENTEEIGHDFEADFGDFHESEIPEANDPRIKCIDPIEKPRNFIVNSTKCVIEETVLEDQTNLFENSINLIGNSVSQSFLGDRKKARRRTGKKIVKRKLDLDDFYPCKKIRIDKLENPVILFEKELRELANKKAMTVDSSVNNENDSNLINKKMKKNSSIENSELISGFETEKSLGIELKKEIAALKAEILKKENENLKKIQEEKLNLEQLRNENLLISARIQKELQELCLFKQNLISELKNDGDKKLIKERYSLLEKIKQEKEQIKQELARECDKMEVEKTFIFEEKKKLENLKTEEFQRLEAQKKKAQQELETERKRISLEKRKFGVQIEEQTKRLENERILFQNERERIKKSFELERERINKTLCEERERINQTFLEISNKQKEIVPMGVKKEVDVKLPIGFKPEYEHKKTLGFEKSINDLFKEMKTELPKQEPTAVKSVKNVPLLDINRIDPHSLYKKSIDIQTNSNDPKKYLAKTVVPFYSNEDEFESEDKKFPAALFTKDPKLNYIVKTQNHTDIRNFFGNSKELDVEKIFSEIENVSNFSPNKLRKRNK